MRETFYDILGLKPGATAAEIHAAYRGHARRYHPDVYHSPDANHRMARINLAYETLADPELRARYDIEIGPPHATAPGRPPPSVRRPESPSPASPPAAPSAPGGLRRFARRTGVGMLLLALVLGIKAYNITTWKDGAGSVADRVGDSFEAFRDNAGYDPAQRRIEDCYISHAAAVHGNAAEKALLDQCLSEAKATATAAPSAAP